MKKIFQYILFAAALGSLAAACDSVKEEGTVAGKREVKFSAAIGSFTVKATDTAFEDGDAIGVYAEDPINVNNVRLTFTGGQITPDEPIYWGSNQLVEQTTRFYAYYPYNEEWSSRWLNSTMIPADQTTPEGYRSADLMISRALSAPADGAVKLNFIHAHAKMIITIDNQLGDLGVSTVSLSNVCLSYNGSVGDEIYADSNTWGNILACPITLADGTPAWTVILPAGYQTRPVIQVVMEDFSEYTIECNQSVYFSRSCCYNAKVVLTDSQSDKIDFNVEVSDWVDNGDYYFTYRTPDQSFELTPDLQEIIYPEDGTEVEFTQIVQAIGSEGFVMADGKYGVYVNADPYGIEYGDVLHVKGTKQTVRNIAEIQDAEIEILGTTQIYEMPFDAAPDAFGEMAIQASLPFWFEGGALSFNGEAYELSVDGGTRTAVLLGIPGSKDMDQYLGCYLHCQAYWLGWDDSHNYFLVTDWWTMD